jgi:4-azaleucine resistance transporter AzlC
MTRAVIRRALRYSLPVLLGYLAIGVAFGLFSADSGYPWYLALFMSVVMYAGAGQFIAIALFASGAGLAEMLFVEFIINARHIAYGAAMLSRFNIAPRFKPYLIFALTDETFALLSSLENTDTSWGERAEERGAFLFLVSLFNQSYWVAGSVLGALAGSLLPFKMTGVDYALSALFIVLLVEQILRVKRAAAFITAAAATILCTALLSKNVSLIASLAASLAAVKIAGRAARPLESAID